MTKENLKNSNYWRRKSVVCYSENSNTRTNKSRMLCARAEFYFANPLYVTTLLLYPYNDNFRGNNNG